MDLIKSPQLPQQLIDKYDREAGRYWDLFYRRNEDRFFKDRHYFDREFPELLTAKTVLEVGCGVGNTIFPLLDLNPTAFIYACDFAPSAVALVRCHPQYAASGRVHAFVADITAAPELVGLESGARAAPAAATASQLDPANDSSTVLPMAAAHDAASSPAASDSSSDGSRTANGWVLAGDSASRGSSGSGSGCGYGSGSGSGSGTTHGGLAGAVPAGSVDACCMVFVLSAISPERMPQAICNVARTLKPGTGQILFRDYAVGDLAEGRLAQQGRSQRIQDNFYARWDGTRAYYFTEVGLQELFASQGFRCESLGLHERVVENRKQQLRMERRYIQAVFTYCGTANDASDTEAPSLLGRQGQETGVQQVAQQPARHNSSRQAAEQHDNRDGSIGSQSTSDLSLVELGPVTFAVTGVTPCSAQVALAHLLLASPSALLQRSLLELGGAQENPSGLASLAALRWCRYVVATSSSASGLDLLRQNARQNSPLVLIERLRLQQFAWRDCATADSRAAAASSQQPRLACQGSSGSISSREGDSYRAHGASSTGGTGGNSAAGTDVGGETKAQLAALRTAFPAGFDVVVGADLLQEGSQEEAAHLASCLAALLSHAPHAVVLLSQGLTRSRKSSTGSSCSSGDNGSSGEAGGGLLQSLTEAAARVGLLAGEVLEGSRKQVQSVVEQAFEGGVEFLCLRRGS